MIDPPRKPIPQYKPIPQCHSRKCRPEEVVHYWVHTYQLTHTDELPTLKCLMCKSGYSMGTVSRFRATYLFSE